MKLTEKIGRWWQRLKAKNHVQALNAHPTAVIKQQPLKTDAEPAPQLMHAMFFDADALRVQPQPVYRIDFRGQRFYYVIDPEGKLVFYNHVTNIISSTLPTSPYLIDWLVAQGGREEGKAVADEAAEYGTFMHAMIQRFILTGVDLDIIDSSIVEYCELNNVFPREDWEDKIKNDLIAFAQFYNDRKVKPLAIEVVLVSADKRYGGAVDLLCELEFNGKRIIAIVDFKSGRKQFHESHQLQLIAYQRLVHENFPDIKVDALFNWSPKEFTPPKPTYNFKNQTPADPSRVRKWELMLDIFELDANPMKETYYNYSGILKPAHDVGLNIVECSLAEKLYEAKQ